MMRMLKSGPFVAEIRGRQRRQSENITAVRVVIWILTEAADGRYDKNVRSGHPGKEKDGSRRRETVFFCS